MPTIDIIIRNKTASAVNPPHIVCGNSDYNVKFDFDEEWQAHNNKIGVFAYNRCGEWQSEKVLFEGDTCPVPALHGVRSVWIGVTAGDVRTSTPADVHCRMGATDFSDAPEKPSADIWGQILAKLDSIGTGGAAPDWAQNDPDGEGYIKNRCGGYDNVQPRESDPYNMNCTAGQVNTGAGTIALFTPSVGDIMSVTVEGNTKEYTVQEGTWGSESVLWFGTLNPSSITDDDSYNAFASGDKWFVMLEGYNSEVYLDIYYGSNSEFDGKTVCFVQRGFVSVPVKIRRKYLDVDETTIKTTEKGALYRASMTGEVDTLGANATNLGVQIGAIGKLSLSVGNNTKATGSYSVAFGDSTESGGIASATFGNNTKTTGLYATAFGNRTKATGKQSVAFGDNTEASNESTVAFGYYTKATGKWSASFGYSSTASNENTVAFGNRVKASGVCSAAFGYGTKAVKETQFVCGLNNEEDTANRYRFIVGIGTANTSKNGFAVTTKGEIVMPDPNATSTTYMKARFNSDGTITLSPVANPTTSYTTECTANRVTAITAESTDTQYPTAKAVYDAIQAAIANLNNTGE